MHGVIRRRQGSNIFAVGRSNLFYPPHLQAGRWRRERTCIARGRQAAYAVKRGYRASYLALAAGRFPGSGRGTLRGGYINIYLQGGGMTRHCGRKFPRLRHTRHLACGNGTARGMPLMHGANRSRRAVRHGTLAPRCITSICALPSLGYRSATVFGCTPLPRLCSRFSALPAFL